ncbi:MAG: hypothetical protein V4588_00330, partial [Pseudomonadota bacterium]
MRSLNISWYKLGIAVVLTALSLINTGCATTAQARRFNWIKSVCFARLASYFPLLAQRKVIKGKGIPSRLFPALLTLLGANRACEG